MADNSIFRNLLGRNPEEKEAKIRLTQQEKEQEFIRSRDHFQAGMNDEELSIHKNPDVSDLTRWQQDLSKDIEGVIHDLRREVLEDGQWKKQKVLIGYDQEGNPVYDELDPIVNELGIRTIVSLLKPLLSRNLMMSNYNEERILMKLKRAVSTLIIHLGYNYKLYGMNKTDLDAVVQMFRDVVEPTHFRSLNNGERNFLNTTTKRMETHSLNPLQKEKNRMGFFNT